MKKSLFILITLCLSMNIFGFVFADDSVAVDPVKENLQDLIGVKGPLEFNQTVFKLAWTANPDDTYYAQEYLPDGENVDTFNQMLAIHVFIKDISPRDAVFEKAFQISAKLGKGSLVYFTGSADEKIFILDFLVEEKKLLKRTLVEYNLYRYQQIDLANEKKALVVYMYCKRSYGADTTAFLKSLADVKKGYRDEMFNTEIPVVTIADN